MVGANKEEILQCQKLNEQLRREVKIQRKKVSVSAKELMNYVTQQQNNDPLCNKVPASENPFRERNRACLVL